MRIALLIALLALFSACSSQRTARVEAEPPLTTEERRIVEIAQRAVALHYGWTYQVDIRRPRKKPDGGWAVVVWRLPIKMGGNSEVMIDENGKVTGYGGGL